MNSVQQVLLKYQRDYKKGELNMAYLIARDRKSHGCFALKIKHGKHLVELKRRLNKIVGYKGVVFYEKIFKKA